MDRWEFLTRAFRDPPELRARRPRRPEGAALAAAVRAHLLASDHPCGEIAPGSLGWAFTAQGPEGRYRCAFALDPWDESEAREGARIMLLSATVAKRPSLREQLLGVSPSAAGEAVPSAVRGFLAGHPDLRLFEAG